MDDNKETFALELLQEVKRTAKRYFVLSIVLLLSLMLSNFAWLIYESQMESVNETKQTIENVTETDSELSQEIIKEQ